MNILVVGGTGFIGRATIAYLQGKSHKISALVRDIEKAKSLLGEDVRLIDLNSPSNKLRDVLESTDAVINLAGAPLAGVRWNRNKKQDFISSRVGINEILTDHINNCINPPSVFISANAVGIYGDREAEVLKETSSIGSGFLTDLCSEWEQAALKARKSGARVCSLRIGVVLGREGGILKRLVPLFEMGLGNYIGNGNQKMPWIHLIDVVRAIDFCLSNKKVDGPINLTSPFPITSKEFSIILASITRTKIMFSIPSFLLKIRFGEGDRVLTNSLNVIPNKLIEAGFKFVYESSNTALKDEVNPNTVTIQKANINSGTKESSVIVKPPAQYELRTSIPLKSNSDQSFAFLSSPLNLGLATPSWMEFKILEIPHRIDKGSRIRYRIRLGLFKVTWLTVITTWNPNTSFIDFQEKGPFALWWHEHQITSSGIGSSTMEDRVLYRVPFGIIGKILHGIFIKRMLVRIFSFRRRMIQLRLG